MLDLSPENFPNYRALLFDLAQLWTPPEPPPSTPPAATTPAPSVEARLEALCARVTRLEQSAATAAPVPAPPPSPKPPKPPYVDVSQATADSRWNCWAPTGTLDARYSGLPPSVAQAMFARHNGLSVREFARWFSPHRTHAPGSPQDTKYRERIHQALERLPKPCVTQ
jgi:hypothetical protein